ncbi:MAG: YdcF family protein [Proteobacteria bacterium]|nr:YdcF family protein [Verrucomicrobiota bacterium]NBU07884.1 YdcF family protein [Pseudomonadota bacterium]
MQAAPTFYAAAMLNYALRVALTLLEPIGFIWACILGVAIFLLRRRQWRPAAVLAALAALMWVFGATPLPGRILAALERPWVGVKRTELPTADAVVLLGGFLAPSREEVGQVHFNGSADRAVTALELIRLGKAKVLAVGGGSSRYNGEVYCEADSFKQLVDERKLSAAEVISLGGCKNTRHEAEKIGILAREHGWKRILLVTSASHMKRAAAVFRSTTALEVIPAPCAFLTQVSVYGYEEFALVPDVGGFAKISNVLHERIGWWVYRWRGWISAEEAAR